MVNDMNPILDEKEKKIDSIAKKVGPNDRMLLNLDSNFYYPLVKKLIVSLVKNGYQGVIVSFDYEILDVFFSVEDEIDVSKFSIIDCVSIIAGKGTPPIRGIIEIHSPYDYNNFMFYLQKELKKRLGEKLFILFLSINTASRFYPSNDFVANINTTMRVVGEFEPNTLFTIDRRISAVQDSIVLENYIAKYVYNVILV